MAIVVPERRFFADDPNSPGKFGFDEWVSVSNFFDFDPIMSRAGKFDELQGDSSELAVSEAVRFLDRHRSSNKPLFGVIWFGSPHSPFKASPEDRAAFAKLNEASANTTGNWSRWIGVLGDCATSFASWESRNRHFSFSAAIMEDSPRSNRIRSVDCEATRGVFTKVAYGFGDYRMAVEDRCTHLPTIPHVSWTFFRPFVELVKLPADSMIQPIDGKSF